MKLLQKTIILNCLLLLVPFMSPAQEILTGISQNATIAKAAQNAPAAHRTQTAVRLPFIDDFSNYTGYPDANKWLDRQAFINNTFPVVPPTLGVATLDALNSAGRIYAHAERTPFHADTLTSLPIRLDSNFTLHRPMRVEDSLYFSFYYQPGGACQTYPAVGWERIGDAPETGDKLVLEFGYATGNMVFTGYEYGTYIIEEGQYYIAGDTIDNPFMPGCIYIFESNAFAGESILMPIDSIFGPEFVWNEVWSTNGVSVDEWLAENNLQYFKQVLIPITDEQYFRNNFQFRFRNYASLDLDSWSGNNIVGWSSNCDQWHIDYVKLDVNRSHTDLYPNDVAFVMPTTSALRQYQAMPWHQYRPTDMATQFHNELANIANSTKNTFYNYQVVKLPNTVVHTSTTNNENAAPYYNSGLHTYPSHATPSIDFSYSYDNADSATYRITHIFRMEGSNDACLSNDTCVFEQKFQNYYAYDDGTAEAGYSLLSTMSSPEASLAVQFTLAEPDTLRCVRMWFNSVLNDENFADFTLMVWGDDNGMPGEVLYSLPALMPAHAEAYLDFVNYYPEEPVALEGTFYVGFYQHHDTQLNLGFDQNNDARGHFFYKTANTWNESFYKGAPMIRPVVGKAYDHSGVASREESTIEMYPNPTTGMVHLANLEDADNLQCQIYDVYGRLLSASAVEGRQVDLSQFNTGIYIIRILKENQIITTEKIVKR
ncbi:MAG: T9SS type A sorting domain-containing protein [Bacteroidales bacterium]|nr:T9SS type A sorting domain-containing protein [Bacteroidales bacterium]